MKLGVPTWLAIQWASSSSVPNRPRRLWCRASKTQLVSPVEMKGACSNESSYKSSGASDGPWWASLKRLMIFLLKLLRLSFPKIFFWVDCCVLNTVVMLSPRVILFVRVLPLSFLYRPIPFYWWGLDCLMSSSLTSTSWEVTFLVYLVLTIGNELSEPSATWIFDLAPTIPLAILL